MVLKKVLGFATTMSLILLVMVAPTTTATASLQQQEGNATIDEPNIPDRAGRRGTGRAYTQ
jgi:hypothetical protein